MTTYSQHDAFVTHALNTIASLKTQITALEEKIQSAEQQQQMGDLQRDGDEWEANQSLNNKQVSCVLRLRQSSVFNALC